MATTIYTKLKEVLPKEKEVDDRLNAMFVHRSLIALNNAGLCEDTAQFKKEVKEIVNNPLLRTVINSFSFSQGFKQFKAYYILAKWRLTSIILLRYQLKRK